MSTLTVISHHLFVSAAVPARQARLSALAKESFSETVEPDAEKELTEVPPPTERAEVVLQGGERT